MLRSPGQPKLNNRHRGPAQFTHHGISPAVQGEDQAREPWGWAAALLEQGQKADIDIGRQVGLRMFGDITGIEVDVRQRFAAEKPTLRLKRRNWNRM